MEDTLATQEQLVDILAFIHMTFLNIIAHLNPLTYFPFSHKSVEKQALGNVRLYTDLD